MCCGGGVPIYGGVAVEQYDYGVATISRLLEIIDLFLNELYTTEDILHKRPIILRSLLIIATHTAPPQYICLDPYL